MRGTSSSDASWAAARSAIPHYLSPDVRVGEPAFERSLEAHTLSTPVGGNRAQLLLNGDQIFPAMLMAIRQARYTITFMKHHAFTTVQDDPDITPVLKFPSQLFVPIQAGAGD